MERTGQIWSSTRHDVFVVLGRKTMTTKHSTDVWWYVLYLDGDHSGTDDVIFESSDRPWEKRGGLRRVT
jgi:hypothetical protein